MMKRIFSKTLSPEVWFKSFSQPHDLPSIQQIMMSHIQMLNKTQAKFIKTTDSKTLQIAENILKNNSFLKENVLGTPSSSTSETGSLKIKLCSINRHPEKLNQYLKWRESGKGRIISIGGPSASDQAFMATLIPQIKQNYDVEFYCRNYLETNVLHSANQSHARHGNALNADPVLSGRHLLPLVFKRLLFKSELEDVTKPDYIKVDVKLGRPQYYMDFFRNEMNGLVQILKGKFGMATEHDINRLQSVTSQDIQKVLEKASNMELTSNNKHSGKEKSMAIHLIFTGDSLEEIKEEQSQFGKVKQIKWNQVPIEEIKSFFPESTGIMTAFRYLGDYSNKFDMYSREAEAAKARGAVWKENKSVSKVYLDQDENGKAFACGVQFEDGQFVPANKIHLTLGYKASYEFESSEMEPLNSRNIPATGVSSTMLLKMTPALKKIIDEREGAMELAIINSHWTIIGHNEQHVLIRSTAGGNTGVQTYRPSHFLNLCANTRKIFGQAFVGVVSVYGCVRAINYKNSTQFADMADGLVISYGKGGTGNTKRASEAYKALKYLGFSEQLQKFFSSYSVDRVDIPSTIEYICSESEKSNLYYKNHNKTRRALFE